MKTKLYIEPGTELDWDNENHRRQIEEEAFREHDEHPKPTMKPPERSRFWWFWRMFGYLVMGPARWAWRKYHWYSYHPETGKSVYWFPSSQKVHDWLWSGGGPFRRFLYWLLMRDYQCPHCGFDDFHDEYTIYGQDGVEVRTIDLFEHVDGGGVDYWGEGQDARGWLWCYRCGSVSWEHV